MWGVCMCVECGLGQPPQDLVETESKWGQVRVRGPGVGPTYS